MEVAQQMRAMAVPLQGSAVAMGFFDGVHKGHQAVIQTAVEAARRQGLAPALFTFRLPPESRIKGPRLLPTEEKHRRVAAMGVQHYMAPAFEEFRSLTPEQFVDDLLVGCFRAKVLCCGENFTFGRNKAGNVEVLEQLCAQRGLTLQVVPMQMFEGRPVSSTRIRYALLHGDVLNENVGVEKIREYVYFTDTKASLPESHPDEPYFMGVHIGSAYYFYYEKQAVTTLNREFLHTVKTKADAYVIYADLCTLSEAELEKYHITFKKIPRDITKL